MKRRVRTLFVTLMLTLTMSTPVFAGQWELDNQGWWYQNDDGSYIINSWQWIDGRCYYFNQYGYCLTNTTTPDGCTVDESGVWVLDGIVQVKQKEQVALQQKKGICGTYKISFGSEGGAELEITYSSGDDLFYAAFNGSWLDYAGGTEGYLIAHTDGTDSIWEYYVDGNHNPSMSLKYDGLDSITITPLDGRNFGGMEFPGFGGIYSRTAEYPIP